MQKVPSHLHLTPWTEEFKQSMCQVGCDINVSRTSVHEYAKSLLIYIPPVGHS